MGYNSVDAISSSFVAPSPIKWRQPAFGGATVPAITPVKKESTQAETKHSINPFSVTSFNLNCPKRDFDTIDMLG